MEQETNYINDELLVKCLLGEASSEEIEAIEEWRKTSTQNDRYFEDFKLIWEKSQKLAARSIVNTDAAWNRFQQRVAQADQQQEVLSEKTIALKPLNWLRIAAILVIMIGAGLTFFYMNRAPQLIVRNAGEKVLVDTLPDGSVITLNSYATLTYPEKFSGDTRLVSLNGEAFFNITPNKSKPFIIKANGVDVKVVGTSFNVKTSTEETEVVVETGIVEVTKLESNIKLAPHERTVVKRGTTQPVKDTVTDELYNYYRTRRFECNNTPLPRLVKVLNEAYHAQIIIADTRLNTILVNTTFQDDSLQEIFDVITSTYNVRVERDGERFLLQSRN